jgi:hypothetical protein
MNMTTATDGITVADTMMTGTAGTTTSGSSGINIAPPAIPTSKVVRAQGGHIAFLKERAAILNQRASEAAAVAREAATDAADFNNAHASIVYCSVLTASSVMRSIQMCHHPKEQRSQSCHRSTAIVYRLISLI